MQIFGKISIFSGILLKNFDFSGKNCSFTAISEQIILGYFSSKVTTFEHSSCT